MPRDGSNIWSPPAGTTATPSTAIESAKYNALVADITADLNAPRPIVAGGTGATTAGAALTALGAQPLDAGLTSIAGLTTAADHMIYTTASDVYAVATLTAAGRALLDDADAAAQRTTLGLVIGTNVQAQNASLASLAGLTLAAGDILYATGANTLVKLPIGTAGQVPAVNAGATALEYVSGPLGAGQTWQDLTASRAGSTSYQNLSGRTIAVSVIQNSTGGGNQYVNLEVSVDNATWVIADEGTSNSGSRGQGQAVIPNNYYYRAIFGAAGLRRWAELR